MIRTSMHAIVRVIDVRPGGSYCIVEATDGQRAEIHRALLHGDEYGELDRVIRLASTYQVETKQADDPARDNTAVVQGRTLCEMFPVVRPLVEGSDLIEVSFTWDLTKITIRRER